MGINGGLRRDELTQLSVDNINKDDKSVLIVNVKNTKKVSRRV